MQFLNIGGAHTKPQPQSQPPQKPLQPPQNPPSTKLTSIQKQLNSLCCQHDSLMPLLQLNSYQSICYRWENSLKAINKKLSDYQQSLVNIAGGGDGKDGDEDGKEGRDGREGMLGRVRENLEEVRGKLGVSLGSSSTVLSEFNPQSRLIMSLYEPLNQPPLQILNPLTELQQQSAQSLQQLKKYINISLALFKNQLLLSEYPQPHQTTLSSQSQQPQPQPQHQLQQQTLQKLTSNIFEPLKKDIQYLRNNLQVQDIRDFHQKTMNRISCDLVQVQDMLDILQGEGQEQADGRDKDREKEREKWYGELGVIGEKVKFIGWQIKGMRKKYYFQISRMYAQQKDAFQVNIFEKLVSKDLQLLQNAYNSVNNKLLTIRNQFQF